MPAKNINRSTNDDAADESFHSVKDSSFLLNLYKEISMIKDELDLICIITERINERISINSAFILLNSEKTDYPAIFEPGKGLVKATKKVSEIPVLIRNISPECAFGLSSTLMGNNARLVDLKTERNELPEMVIKLLPKDGFLLFCAISLGGKEPGWLMLYNDKFPFQNKQIPFFSAIADAIAIGVSSVLTLKKSREETVEKETLLSISQAMAAVQDKSELLKLIVEKLQAIFGFYDIGLAIINEGEGTFTDWSILMPDLSPSAANFALHTAELETIIYSGSGIDYMVSEIERTGLPVILAITPELIEKYPLYAEVLAHEILHGYKEMWFAALKTGGRLYGTLNFNSLQSGYFSQFDSKFFVAVADLIAIAVANIVAKEDIEKREKEKSLQIEIGKAIAEEDVWTARLLRCARLLQPEIPFSFFLINLIPDDDSCTPFGFYQTGSDEYQVLEGKELQSILGMNSAQMKKNWQSITGNLAVPDSEANKVSVNDDSNPTIAALMKYFNLTRYTTYPIWLTTYKLVTFTFFGKAEMPYNIKLSRILDGIQHYTGLCFDRALAYDELRQVSLKIKEENKYLQEEIKVDHNLDKLIGNSAALNQVLKNITLVASTDTTVLILGETGTGKELIARSLHNTSPRASKSFIKVNCAVLPAQLIESELFGHEKGSFTGAIEKRIGKFELADGGSIFLDEIGELPLDLQSKLLRVLQEKEFERIGGNKTIHCDIRIIAATNRQLDKEVAKGLFRSDLYYRLNVFPVLMPPLRDRREDIPLLATHFAHKFFRKMNKPFKVVGEEMLIAFDNYEWPGNIRELENIIEHAVIVSQDAPDLKLSRQLIVSQQLPLKNVFTDLSSTEIPIGFGSAKTEKEAREKEAIIAALKKTNGRIRGEKGAALILNIPPTSLESKMKKYGFSKHQFEHIGNL